MITNSVKLRENLLKVIEEISNIDSSIISKKQIEKAKLVTSASSKVISELKTQIEYQKVTGIIRRIPFLETTEEAITTYPRHK